MWIPTTIFFLFSSRPCPAELAASVYRYNGSRERQKPDGIIILCLYGHALSGNRRPFIGFRTEGGSISPWTTPPNVQVTIGQYTIFFVLTHFFILLIRTLFEYDQQATAHIYCVASMFKKQITFITLNIKTSDAEIQLGSAFFMRY